MITRYVATTHVARIEERMVRRPRPGSVGVGDKAEMVDVSTGWWIVTESPQPYAICVGDERPTHAVGDEVRMTLEISAPVPRPEKDATVAAVEEATRRT